MLLSFSAFGVEANNDPTMAPGAPDYHRVAALCANVEQDYLTQRAQDFFRIRIPPLRLLDQRGKPGRGRSCQLPGIAISHFEG